MILVLFIKEKLLTRKLTFSVETPNFGNIRVLLLSIVSATLKSINLLLSTGYFMSKQASIITGPYMRKPQTVRTGP